MTQTLDRDGGVLVSPQCVLQPLHSFDCRVQTSPANRLERFELIAQSFAANAKVVEFFRLGSGVDPTTELAQFPDTTHSQLRGAVARGVSERPTESGVWRAAIEKVGEVSQETAEALGHQRPDQGRSSLRAFHIDNAEVALDVGGQGLTALCHELLHGRPVHVEIAYPAEHVREPGHFRRQIGRRTNRQYRAKGLEGAADPPGSVACPMHQIGRIAGIKFRQSR